jgi:hypothetical protein
MHTRGDQGITGAGRPAELRRAISFGLRFRACAADYLGAALLAAGLGLVAHESEAAKTMKPEFRRAVMSRQLAPGNALGDLCPHRASGGPLSAAAE